MSGAEAAISTRQPSVLDIMSIVNSGRLENFDERMCKVEMRKTRLTSPKQTFGLYYKCSLLSPRVLGV